MSQSMSTTAMSVASQANTNAVSCQDNEFIDNECEACVEIKMAFGMSLATEICKFVELAQFYLSQYAVMNFAIFVELSNFKLEVKALGYRCIMSSMLILTSLDNYLKLCCN